MLRREQISKFIDDQIPKNTKTKTKTDVGTFKRLLSENVREENRELEDISRVELNEYLKSFFITARKLTGEEYEPDSIKGMRNSIDRYLSEKNYKFSVSRSDEFKGARDVLAAKGKQLKKDGKGRKPHRADPVSEDEEKVLWEKGILGKSSPKSRDEHHKLRWGDLSIKEDVNGLRYIQFQERDTKTRKDPRDERPILPRVYATPNSPETCPVELLLQYTHRRPLSMCEEDSPFYLQYDLGWEKGNWHKCQPLGVHSLGTMMKILAENGELPGRKTNHSGRKTTVKRLREADFECKYKSQVIKMCNLSITIAL